MRAEELPFSLGVLILAAPLEETDATLDRLAMIEVLVAVAVLLSIAAAGIIAIRRGLRPLVRIEEDAGRDRRRRPVAAGRAGRRSRPRSAGSAMR